MEICNTKLIGSSYDLERTRQMKSTVKPYPAILKNTNSLFQSDYNEI